jgi:hypothetical protein
MFLFFELTTRDFTLTVRLIMHLLAHWQIYACRDSSRGDSVPGVPTALSTSLLTLTDSGSNSTASALLAPFITAAAASSSVPESAISFHLEVGTPAWATAPAPPPVSSGSGATAAPLAVMVGAGVGGSAAFLCCCLILMFAWRRRRQKEAPHATNARAESATAEVIGVNPMHSARAPRGVVAVGRRASSLSRPPPRHKRAAAAIAAMGRAPALGATDSDPSVRHLSNPIFASSHRRVIRSPTQLTHHAADGVRSKESALPPVVNAQRGTVSGASKALRLQQADKGRSAQPQPPETVDAAPSLSTLNAFKSNPLHVKRSRGSNSSAANASVRTGRAVKRDSDAAVSPAATQTISPGTSGAVEAMIDSPLRRQRPS